MLDLDITERPVSVPAPVVGREFFGLARDLRRRVEKEDDVYIRTVTNLIMPAQMRLRKFPHRKLRPEMLAELVQRWRFMEPCGFRTHIEATLERYRCSVLERRACAGLSKQLNRGWVGDDEADVGVAEITLTADGNRLQSRSRMRCTFSLHALARRYQRGGDTSDAAILHDMELMARIDPSTLEPGGYKVTTDERGGGWRGRTVRVAGEAGEVTRVLAIRTWLA